MEWPFHTACMCVCVCVFAPCRALGIRHYYLRVYEKLCKYWRRESESEAEIWTLRGLGIDNLMVALGEKIGSRGDWRRWRGRGGIWTLTVAMAAFGCEMRQISAAPKNLYRKHYRELRRRWRRRASTATKIESLVEGKTFNWKNN